jgi:hypothetical protein
MKSMHDRGGGEACGQAAFIVRGIANASKHQNLSDPTLPIPDRRHVGKWTTIYTALTLDIPSPPPVAYASTR